jgi:hypothetical protein
MSARSRLVRPEGPTLHRLVAGASEACDFVRSLEREADVPLAARVVRGAKSRTRADFFNEAAAALQFPYYFGQNWDAFHDCLADLRWLRAEAVVVCITDAVHLLDRVEPEQLRTLADVIEESARHLSRSRDDDESPRSLHVIFHATPEDRRAFDARWAGLGIGLDPMAPS